jgi:hypothetical protein
MKTAWQDSDRNNLLSRIERVNGSESARWGKMTAGGMLNHLAQSLRMAVGELPCKSKKLPIRYFPLKQLVIYAIPFPKGAPTAPEFLQGSDTPAEQSKAEVQRLFTKFLANRGKPWPEHPAFGTLTDNAWGVLVYRHFDHHLRQFGV